MNTKRVFFIATLILSAITFAACSSNKDDTTPPEVTLITPVKHAHFLRGEQISIEFEVAAKAGINNYKVDIHWGAGHSHAHVSTASTRAEVGEDVPWGFQRAFDNEKGKTKAYITVLTDKIPDNAKYGEYHLGVLVTDMVGKDTKKYIEIEIADHKH